MEKNREWVKQQIEQTLQERFAVSPQLASDEMFYKALAFVVRTLLAKRRREFSLRTGAEGKKQVAYLCMEFLLGRSLKNNLYQLGMVKAAKEALCDFGVQLEKLYDCEPDAGLGNGGLGRLAACYMDAMASQEICATGYSILYEYGIFRQKIVDGWQTEEPDDWLPGGDIWLSPEPEQAIEVRFGGQIEEFWDQNYHHITHRGYTAIRAVPYDMYLSGYHSDAVSLLRLWKAEGMGFDMELFNRGDYRDAVEPGMAAGLISKVLYPNDNHQQGKQLRLRQQYFLVAASLGDIVNRHMYTYGTLENFAEKNAVHLNDTHPVLAIPELMRILLDDCGYGWDEAWAIVQKTFAYTNHTVMSEALEEWDEETFKVLLPRLYQIVAEIDRRFCRTLFEQHHLPIEEIQKMAVLGEHRVRMANLAVVGSHKVNGVSKLHTRILQEELFAPFCRLQPAKFVNVTNGIASRRWLLQSNPGLTALLCELIGDGFCKEMEELSKLRRFEDDKAVLQRLAAIKRENKERLAAYLHERQGITVDPGSLFDVQVKRLHEYKRQHLNALHVLTLYRRLLEDPGADIQPRTFLFGAKAAPGYFLAKQIIRLLCAIQRELTSAPALRDRLQVVFLEDYSVTLSEILMPAAEVSEQISLAGTEASGTGNMKLMLNGAVTLGTLDGANVEIREAVGDENILVFGMTADEVRRVRQAGYQPQLLLKQDEELAQVVQLLRSGIGGQNFPELADAITYTDTYMAVRDFPAYQAAQNTVQQLYRQPEHWQNMSLCNIAGAGRFCADRAVREYAKTIWGLTKNR